MTGHAGRTRSPSRTGPASRSGATGSTGPAWIVAVDTGGTYTDAIAISSDGLIKVAKVPSTPADPGLAFERAVAGLAAEGVAPGDVSMLFHGTTIATNALLTGGLARVVLATTAGFRDVLGYRDGTRPAVYDLEQPRPRELVPRRDRIEVAERLSGRGEVLTPLTEEEIERVVAEIAGRQPAAVAVSFLFSYLDSRHEDALAEALAKRLPDVPVTVSSAVAREFREYPRTATAALNAGLRPVVGAYLAQLRSRAARARRRRAAADHAVQRRVPARRAGRRRGAPAGALRPRGRRRGGGGAGRRLRPAPAGVPRHGRDLAGCVPGPRRRAAGHAHPVRRGRPDPLPVG